MLQYIFMVAATMLGVTLGSVLNYFLFRRLFKKQTVGAIETAADTEQGKMVTELLMKLKEFTESEEAKVIPGKLIKALDQLTGE